MVTRSEMAVPPPPEWDGYPRPSPTLPPSMPSIAFKAFEALKIFYLALKKNFIFNIFGPSKGGTPLLISLISNMCLLLATFSTIIFPIATTTCTYY